MYFFSERDVGHTIATKHGLSMLTLTILATPLLCKMHVCEIYVKMRYVMAASASSCSWSSGPGYGPSRAVAFGLVAALARRFLWPGLSVLVLARFSCSGSRPSIIK